MEISAPCSKNHLKHTNKHTVQYSTVQYKEFNKNTKESEKHKNYIRYYGPIRKPAHAGNHTNHLKKKKKPEKRSRNLSTEITDTWTNEFAEPKLHSIQMLLI